MGNRHEKTSRTDSPQNRKHAFTAATKWLLNRILLAIMAIATMSRARLGEREKSSMTVFFDSRNLMIVFAAAMLSAAVMTTNALAAGHAHHRGTHGAGRLRGGFSGPLTAPPTAPPAFNPWYRYTMPQAPETPVSPASPGSVFGDN
jgi:hypothetical protein